MKILCEMRKYFMTLMLALATVLVFAQTDSIVRQYSLPAPRIISETTKQEPKSPSEALRDLVSEPREASILPIPLTSDMLSILLYNFERKGSPLVRELMKESRDGLDVYVLTDKGIYKYDPEKRQLNVKSQGDFRARIIGDKEEWKEAKCFVLAALKTINRNNLATDLHRELIETTDDEGPHGNVNSLLATDLTLDGEVNNSQNNSKNTKAQKEQKPAISTQFSLPKYVVLLVTNEYNFDTK